MKERILSSAVMALAMFFLIASPIHEPFLVALLIVAVLALLELGKLTRQPMMVLGLLPSAAICILSSGPAAGLDSKAPVTILVLTVGVIATRWLVNQKSDRPSLAALICGGWIVGPLVALANLRQSGSAGWESPLLYALFPVWAGDTFAYFVGKALKGPLLAPSISPKKTISGSIANVIAATATGAAVSYFCHFSPALGLACGFTVGTLGQAGDLFESYVKRCMGAKDSSNLIPGHGGVMDRLDSLLFSAPFVSLLVALWPKK